jgi:hypothetical protein
MVEAKIGGIVLSQYASKKWDEISEELEVVYGKIFANTNKLLKAHTIFGFTGIEANIHPKLEDMLLSLRLVDSLLDGVSSSVQFNYSEERVILNCRQMILLVEGVVLALKNNNEQGYEDAIDLMRKQAQV